ncbi:MAG: LysR substrate-binding domain-containing protein [Pseudomonadota bacterium]
MMFETLADARLLVAAGESPSFAEAGRRMGMPPATVTRRIAAMEGSAGLKLFERSTRHLRLTEAGERMIAHARRLLEEAESAAMSMETLRESLRGWVRVSAPVILGQSLLGDIVGSFIARYADCDVFLDLSNHRVDLVAEGYDVAIRVGPVGDGDLVVRKLGGAGAALYGGTNTGRPPLQTLGDLAGRQVGLLRSLEHRSGTIMLTDGDGAMHAIDVVPRLVTLNPFLLRDVAQSTDLVIVLPRMAAYPDVVASRLRCELPAYAAKQTEVSAVFPSRRLMRPAVRAFIDHIAAELPGKLKKYDFPLPR